MITLYLFKATAEHVISPSNGVSAGSQLISAHHPIFTYTLPTEPVNFQFLILNELININSFLSFKNNM